MLKIFLAEDEVVVRETIKRMIPWEELGFELVGEAADGEMALPLLIRQQPDLLITDIKMPFMDGLTLARLAKKEIPGLKVVILSGYDDFNYTKQAVVSGRPFFYLFWVYSSAFAFMRATRFSVLIFESDSESRHQCAAFLFDVFHFVSLFRQWIRRVFNHSGTHINIRLFEGTLRHILQVDIKA